jgi:hypothetical protein
VWGDITDDSLDSDGEIVDPEFAAGALSDWFNGGAPVFNQHCEFYPPAGQGISLEMDPGAPVALRAHITEPTAVSHVENGVYKDFSVGWYDPEYVNDRVAPNGRMVGGWAREVSLVDQGANKSANIKGFSIAKSRAKGSPPELFGVGGAPPEPLSRKDAEAMLEVADGGDRFATALKTKMSARAAKVKAAAMWYAAFKRDIDPDVGEEGGEGVDRDKLDPEDFVLPDEGEGKFPVVHPDDVSDAVSSWGRYKGPTSFEDFKSKLIALCKRKGPSFVAELPDSWNVKKGKTTMATATLKGKGPRSLDSPITADSAPEGRKVCPTCKGDGAILEGNRKCPDCQGKGHVDTEFTKGKKAVKADADDDVDEAIDTLMDDLDEVAEAQAEDVAEGEDKPTDDDVDEHITEAGQAIGALAEAQAADEAADLPGAKQLVGAKSKKRKAKPTDEAEDEAEKAKGGFPFAKDDGDKDDGEKAKKPPADDHDEDEDASDEEMAEEQAQDEGEEEQSKGGKGGKEGKRKGKDKKPKSQDKKPKSSHIPAEVLATHDALCPVFDVEAGPALKSISADWFLTDYHRKSEAGSARDIERAYAALAAAHNVTFMSVPDFGRIRAAAHKALEAAYPDLSAVHGEVRSPDQFKRPFLSGANPDTPTGGFALPTPTMAGTLDPHDFDRMGPVANQQRPSPTSGRSAADMAKTAKGARAPKRKGDGLPKNARMFYSNASKDEMAKEMATLHDHLAKHFPGVCPMAPTEVHVHTDDDDDDKSRKTGKAQDMSNHNLHEHDENGKCIPTTGSKSESDIKLAGLPVSSVPLEKPVDLPEPSGANTGHLAPARSKGVGRGTADRPPAKGDKAERQARELKALRKQNKRLKARQDRFIAEVRQQLSQPDPRARKQRGPGSNFAPLSSKDREERAEAVRAEARRLKTRIHSRNSQVSTDAIEEARAKLPPEMFAAVITADD